MKKKCAAEEEKERVNAVLSGLGEVLEQVKGVSVEDEEVNKENEITQSVYLYLTCPVSVCRLLTTALGSDSSR